MRRLAIRRETMTGPQDSLPPYRADHVGSLLRPARLHEARDAHQQGTLPLAELTRN